MHKQEPLTIVNERQYPGKQAELFLSVWLFKNGYKTVLNPIPSLGVSCSLQVHKKFKFRSLLYI